VQAEKSSSATEIVKGLQKAQLQRWLNRDISPENLFRMLQLDDKQGGVLNNSLLPVWMKFLDAFNIKNPTKKTTLFDTLKQFFSDDQLEKIFIAAQRNPSTNKMGADLFRALHGQKLTDSDLNDLARSNDVLATKFVRTSLPKKTKEDRIFEKETEVLTAKLPGKKQIQVWLKNEHSSDDVFDLLKLGPVGDSILTSPNFKIWRQFITQCINGKPDETMILKLRDQYDFNNSALLIKGWWENGNGVDDVFVTLRLTRIEGNIFDNPKFTTWTKFAKEFYKKNEMIATLTNKYGNLKLAERVQRADKGSTASLSNMLNKVQFDFWYEKMEPNTVKVPI
ncbi:RxLR effector protein, partial [Phytophthora megakarya]